MAVVCRSKSVFSKLNRENVTKFGAPLPTRTESRASSPAGSRTVTLRCCVAGTEARQDSSAFELDARPTEMPSSVPSTTKEEPESVSTREC